jgi:hypothetical protein
VIEFSDRRTLGGVQCIDAITSASIVDPLMVSSPVLLLRPNLSGVYAIMDGPQFHQFTTEFIPASWPSPSNFEITILDPSNRYLPRRSVIQVPQPLPTNPPPATPPFTASSQQVISYGPQQVTLYRGPAAPLGLNWAVVRVSVMSNANPPVALPWAVLQILNGATVMTTGVSDANGEALLAIAGLGLQVSTSPGGPVTEVTTAFTVKAWFDPASLTQSADWVPNPDIILQSLGSASWKTGSAAIQIGPGQTVYAPLTVSM